MVADLGTRHDHLPAATRATTLPEAFALTVAAHGQRAAFAATARLGPQTFADYAARVLEVAAAFRGAGLKHGDTVAFMMTNRREFHWLDLAAMQLGLIATSLYNTSPRNLLEHVLSDSGARYVVTESMFVDRLEPLRATGLIDCIVVIDEAASSTRYTGWVDFLAGGRQSRNLAAPLKSVTPEDVAIVIYTSGSTGEPKGVELTHRNLMFLVRSLQDRCRVPVGASQLSFLPMSHMMARTADHYLQIVLALEVTCCPDPALVGDQLPIVRPSFFASTPRLYEKLRGAIMAAVASAPAEERAGTEAALTLAISQVRAAQKALAAGAAAPTRIEYSETDRARLAGLARMVGLDRVSYAIVGGAPVDAGLVEFFHAIGVPLSEVYGLTESAAAATGNPADRVRIGTVGPPLPGVEMRIADDGEIVLRSDGIMKGYRNQPAATAEVFTDDGWLLTGDVGSFDPDGYLRIVDRKKDIIINAAGKNMSPAQIEATIKQACPLIGHAVVIGDGRRFNVALLIPDPDALTTFAVAQGLNGDTVAVLARHRLVQVAIADGIDRANERLVRVEQIKRYQLLEHPWLPGGDEVTATQKLRRRAVIAKYDAEINRLYDI